MNEERTTENAADEYVELDLVAEHTEAQLERDLDVDTARLGLGDPPCRRCGCNDLNSCEGGCNWVEPDLCSSCAERLRGPAYRRSLRGRKVA